MASSFAEIVFIGFCSFLNVENALSPNLPMPSVVLPRDTDHVPVIAFNTSAVDVAATENGSLITAIDTGKDGYSYFRLDGEQVLIENATDGTPTITNSFAAVPRMTDYAPDSVNDAYNEKVIPPRKSDPSKLNSGDVAAFLLLPHGELASGQTTQVPFEFREDNTDGNPTIRGYFANEVLFTYRAGRIELSTATLMDAPRTYTRHYVFTPKASLAGAVRVWIGNVPCSEKCTNDKLVREIKGDYHGEYSKARHFAAHYAVALKGSPAKAKVRIPFPLPIKPQDAGAHGNGDPHTTKKLKTPATVPGPEHPSGVDVGYCGPDQLP